MKKLDNTHLQQAIAYLSEEPEFNLFLTGDIENFGMASDAIRTYTADDWTDGDFPYFILDYRGNFLVYSKNTDYDVKSVAKFLSSMEMENLSGKQEIIEKLCPYFPERPVQRTYMSRLNQVNPDFSFSDSLCVRRLDETDAESIYSLYVLIKEFSMFQGLSEEQALEKQRTSLKDNIYFGAFENGILTSVASITAATKTSAMIVGVSTRPEYRKRGYASAVVGTLCKEVLAEGRQFLCLFYDNPAAGRIYNRIGFKEMGIWTMLRQNSKH